MLKAQVQAVLADLGSQEAVKEIKVKHDGSYSGLKFEFDLTAELVKVVKFGAKDHFVPFSEILSISGAEAFPTQEFELFQTVEARHQKPNKHR